MGGRLLLAWRSTYSWGDDDGWGARDGGVEPASQDEAVYGLETDVLALARHVGEMCCYATDKKRQSEVRMVLLVSYFWAARNVTSCSDPSPRRSQGPSAAARVFT